MNNLMGFESLPRDVVPYFVLGNTRRATLKNVALYSLISKTFYKTINSKEFFRSFAYRAGSSELLSQEILGLNGFKDRYCALRSISKKIAETFPGATYGDAWVTEEGVSLFTFDPKLGFFQLQKDSLFSSIAFPENMPLDLGNASKAIPCIAKSKDYLAVHGSDQHVHVYNADGKKYLSTYVVTRDIKQMHIREDRLYVVCKDVLFYLRVYDLKHFKELTHAVLGFHESSTRICFGKEYLISSLRVVGGNGVSAVSLPDFKMEIQDATPSQGQSYFFPDEDGFIEVNFQNEFQWDLRKICFKKGEIETKIIKKDLVLSLKRGRKDICLHEDRLLVAYSLPCGGTKLVSYDLLSDQVTELPLIPSMQVAEECFKPRILCMAEKVYYLFMCLDDKSEYISNFTTFTFSKI